MSEIQRDITTLPTINDAEERKRMKRHEELRKKAGRFRILVIGRANAGKTTILKRICDTNEDPEIYNARGEKIDAGVVGPSEERGLHDIKDELVFKSNPGFIFHDSRGFEAGGTDELKKVNDFIAERSKEKKLDQQIHVIWYCIPMEGARPITHAENRFFLECGTGKVPVVAIFTKSEALELKAFTALRKEGKTIMDAKEMARQYAKDNYENIHTTLYEKKYKPKQHVYLRAMEDEKANCVELVEQTAAALSDNVVLERLLISTQQNSVEICIKYAIK